MNREEINRIRENINMKCIVLKETGLGYSEVKDQCTLLMYIDELEKKLDKINEISNELKKDLIRKQNGFGIITDVTNEITKIQDIQKIINEEE